MKIAAHIEFDTFAEAERVFRHLGMLDAPHAPEKEIAHDIAKAKAVSDAKAAAPHAEKPAEHKHVTTEKPLPEHQYIDRNGNVADKPKNDAAAAPTLDDLKAAFQGYLAKGAGRTPITFHAIMTDCGANTKRLPEVPAELYGAIIAAAGRAGPENPLGEAA